jgi:hypothetical protein
VVGAAPGVWELVVVSAPVADELRGVAENGGSPVECRACKAAGRECAYHRGWADGWDACTALVAHVVEAERAAELDPANWSLWSDDELDDDTDSERCGTCGGHGAIPCSWCDGTTVDPGRWSDDDLCVACDAQGDEPCPDCAEPDWSRP